MTLRTVGVKLTAEVSQYNAGLKTAKAATEGFADKLDEAARAGDETAMAMAALGRSTAVTGEVVKRSARGMADELAEAGRKGVVGFGLSEAAAASLDDQIEETARDVQRLQREFSRTGDLTLFQDLDRAMGRLNKHLKVRELFSPKDLVKAGEDMAEGVGLSMMTRLGPLMARMPLNVGALGPVGIAVGTPIAIAAAGIIGSAVAGAVIGGAGIGGIAGGLMLAARDPRVVAAGTELGDEFMGVLERSAAGFVPVTLEAIDLVEKELAGLEPQLQDIFSDAARMVEPLVKGGIGLIKEALPGIIAAVDRAAPVISVIADRLPKIGFAVRDALMDISGDANSAAAGVDLILEGLGGIIRISGQIIGFFTSLFRSIVNVADAALSVEEALLGWNPIFSGKLEEGRRRIDHLKGILDGTATATNDSAEGFRGWDGAVDGAGSAAGTAAAEVRTLNEMIRDGAEANSGYLGGMISMEQAIDDATAAVRENGKTVKNHGTVLDLNTEKGRANATALNTLATSTLNARDKVIGLKGTQAEANAVMERGRQKFIAAAEAAGLTKAAAKRLADQLGLLPKAKAIGISTPGMSAAQSAAADLKRKLDALHSKSIRIDTHYFYTSSGDFHVPGGTILRRWGGITEHAASGLLREAATFTPQGPARYAFAEPATGGEAFIPKHGIPDRSMAILDKAASWYGARVVPGRAAGGSGRGGAVVTNTFHINAGNRDPQAIAAEVSRILAKTGDIWGRGD